MTATDLLRLAGALTDTEVNRLAHALGWPDLHQLRGPHSPALLAGIRWGNPYRNHYSCGPGFPLEEWAPTFEAGLVERAQSTGPGVTFTVTPLGYAVVAVRLRAEIVNADLQPKEGR
jgi:hypothetical protein